MDPKETMAESFWENYRPPIPDTSHLITESEEPADNIFSEKQMWLRWADADDQVIASGAERANAETARANAEAARAAALAARLRELGVDPDSEAES